MRTSVREYFSHALPYAQMRMRGSLDQVKLAWLDECNQLDLYAWLQVVQSMNLYAWLQGCNNWTCVHDSKWSNLWTCMHDYKNATMDLYAWTWVHGSKWTWEHGYKHGLRCMT